MKPTHTTTLYVYYLLLGTFCAITIPALSLANSDVTSRQAIEVTTFESEGAQHVVAKMLVDFTPQYFLNMMSLSDENCAWIDKCVSVTVLKKRDTAQKLIQTHINTPWPFKDRDMVVTSRSEYDKTTKILTIFIEDASNDIPQHPDRIRMTNVYGEWQIKPHHELFELSYTGTANPNGNIPQSFALRFLKASTQQTFENLQIIRESKIDHRLDNIINHD
ncbi:MAG: hypothetical protein ACJAVV_001115 [Alphaproteobacteria bacterium]|jgi:hypothetical protein